MTLQRLFAILANGNIIDNIVSQNKKIAAINSIIIATNLSIIEEIVINPTDINPCYISLTTVINDYINAQGSYNNYNNNCSHFGKPIKLLINKIKTLIRNYIF